MGFASVTAVTLGADPTVVATIAGAAGGLLGALVVLVAGQPPTVAPGSAINIQTPSGEANRTVTV